MKFWHVAALVFIAPAPLLACSFCPGSIKEQNTLGEEMDRAALVFFGRAVNSTLDASTPGKGKTEFRIERILRDHPALKNKTAIVLDRYVPVLNPKDPPRFVVFCDVVKDKLDPYLGRSVASDAVIGYLENARAFRGKKDAAERVRGLVYYFRHFEHADETIAGDAFREFAKASDQEVSQAARQLDPERVRAMMDNPRTNPDYLGLLGFMLGNIGRQGDAEYLRTLAIKTGDGNKSSFDGLLSGYVALKPAEGWTLLRSYVTDAKKPFPARFSAICSMRFCYVLKPQEYRPHVLRCLESMVPDGDVADMAIEDLRKWKLWELTGSVLEQYGKKSHDVPITRRAIVRYALCCPGADARAFVERVRGQDAELVREIELSLEDSTSSANR